ncbi:YCF48-related protein [Paenibacillus sp. 32352]|uniref:WD40/YVTN/BNR-like repeat-containing protein n=1 Tax=Paenibacillus sp. 32352 TaxID=1969111 RepID=UPI00117E281D
MSKPDWYKQAGIEPFKRNHFHGKLSADTKSRIGMEKQAPSRSKRYLGGVAAAALGIFVVGISLLSNTGSDSSSMPPGQSLAATPIIEKSSALIRMIDRNNGWAFGTSVKRTNDGGQTWIDRTPQGYDNSRFEPFLFNERLAWFIVRPADNESNWTIYRTAEGGNSWNSTTLPTKDTWSVPGVNTAFNLYFADEKTGVISFISDPAGGPVKTALYQTTDGGQTWKYLSKIAPDGVLVSTPSGMSFSDKMHGFISFFNSKDNQPEIYATSDGGTSWKRLPLDLPQDIKEAAFIAEHPPQFFGNAKKEGVLPVSYRTLNNEKAGIVWFTTENGGATWSPPVSQDGAPIVTAKDGSAPQGFRPSTALDLKHFWMIDSEAGILYGTSDGGGHWQVLNRSPQLRNAAELKFVDEKIGWVRGEEFFLQSEDGGRSWKEVQSTASLQL